MTFIAKYRGVCRDCEDTIKVGEEVEFDDERNLLHVICPDDTTIDGHHRPVCPHCFCVIPTSGVCDCRE